MHRPSVMKGGAAALATLSCGMKSGKAEDPYGPFKMGMQTYSVRHWKTLDDVLARAKELELTSLEFWNSHIPMTSDPAKLAEIKKKLDDAGVKFAAYGVIGLGEDIKANRAAFE